MPRVRNLRNALAIAAVLIAQSGSAQTAAAPHKFLVLLDPAHGGKDPGATLANHLPEKDVTLAFAQTLRAALNARHLATQSTRETDATLTPTQRAARASQLAPAVCVALHATATGSGIHVLYPLQEFALANSGFLDKWPTGYVPPNHQSQPLAQLLRSSITEAHLPATSEPVADPTLSRERCAAVVIELAPLPQSGAPTIDPSDRDYQQRAAEIVAAALDKYRARQALLDAGASTYIKNAVPR